MTFLDKQREALNVFDVTFFNFGIWKEISFLDGGIAVTNNEEIFIHLKEQRDKECMRPSFRQNMKIIFKLLGCVVAFKKNTYQYLVFLSTKTHILNVLKGVDVGLTKNLPDDFYMFPTNLQLYLAKDRIKKFDAFLEEKREVLKMYYSKFKNNNHLKLDEAELASLLPFRCQRADACKIQEAMFNSNIHTNTIFKRTLPEVRKENTGDFPNATRHTHELTMLPLYDGLTKGEVDKVIKELSAYD